MSRSWKLRKDERGQALTEFAIIAPVMLLLVFGIVDLGRYMYGYLNLQLAAQETVRKGSFGYTDAELAAFARSYMKVKDPALLAVTVTPDDRTRDSGDYVTVTLQEPFTFVTPIVGELLPVRPNIRAYSTIRVE
ncbi:TadE/TadG family type IV pilus assembly protein [Paenibacillus thermotolerans]|uniref:TadE/TadG family type IV pilus assembly protein n=1 Tax=Paenibacillus thermotolerans TaxID=3027807 RepID=UPI002368AD7C|nr:MULTISPECIES: TadE/TadG family type IV pilus assembly protein [unclassified Paenibacillus]